MCYFELKRIYLFQWYHSQLDATVTDFLLYEQISSDYSFPVIFWFNSLSLECVCQDW